MVNNSDKAAVIYNSKGLGTKITVEGIGGENLKSKETEKLQGIHINDNLDWKSNIEEISKKLKQRIGLFCRIRKRVPKNKLIIIAECIFNSVLRYGIAVYTNPVFDKEDLKSRKLPGSIKDLQKLQNNMIRVILGLQLGHHVNMEKTRTKIRMMSVNQMSIYHTLLEAFNVVRNSSSEQIKEKWQFRSGGSYPLRRIDNNDLRVPDKPLVSCTGFTYNAPKLFNKLPVEIKKIEDSDLFKKEVKTWVWKNIPSY